MKNKNAISFSALDRAQHLQLLKSQTFDLLVIGGGATGCGIALDAAARGLKTALVEKEDFASGTSSKSTKLIHGGLRYLKQFEIGLVRETGSERAIVHRLAPHLVLPEKMLLPIIKNGTYGKWAASFGVKVYDLLAGVEKEDGRKMLSKKETFDLEPLLNEETLEGACLYAEYRTDDARLTIELIKRAVSFGALAVNYCAATDFIYTDEQVTGVNCIDHIANEPFAINARQIVSAGGPWVDKLRGINKSINNKRLHLTKGVHIVFPHEKFPLQHAVYFDVADGRMIFAIPRGKVTYVGTTDTNYTANLNRVIATQADATYILAAIKHAFPTVQLSVSDIISNWAGLRPLIHEEGKSPSELSRKDEIFESPSGLISIAGGKLTGYRKMAERIVDLTEKRLGVSFDNCTTDKIPLVADSLENAKAVSQYIKQLEKEMSSMGLEAYHAWYLVTTYGKQLHVILNQMKNYEDVAEVALVRAELWFGVHHEMVNSLEDFFVRRTGRLYFDIKSIDKVKDIIVSDLANYLSWSADTRQKELDRLEMLFYDATHYPENEITKEKA